jgi:hypothetical protein
MGYLGRGADLMSGAHAMFLAVSGAAPGVINGALPNGTLETEATFFLGNDGTYSIAGATGNWVTPATSAIAAFYQVRVVVTAGFFASGTTDTWLDMSSNRSWVCQDGVAVSATFTVTFREKASQVVRSTQAGVVLTATSP